MPQNSNVELPTRRDVLQRAAVGSLAFVATEPSGLCVAQEKTRPLRVIAYNVYDCTGWPKDRAMAKAATVKGQMPDRFANELALYEPDVVNFSESPDESVVKQIAQRLGMNYVRFSSGGNWPGTLLSRFEIVETRNVPLVRGARPGDLFTRHWGQATVRPPNGEPIVIHSAHLHPSPEPDTRLREIPLMLDSMKRDLESGRSMLLIGDLNHTPDTREYRRWLEAGWSDTFTQVGTGDGLTIKSDDPLRRIDYVMAAGPIAKRVVESRPLFEGAFRTNLADPVSFALSDHLPQLAVFE